MTLNKTIEKDEMRFRRQNEDLIRKAVSFKRQSIFDITSGIECSALLKKHSIENTSELIDFVRQIPAEHFSESKKFDPRVPKILLSLFSVFLAALTAFCLENDWIEKSVPFLMAVLAAMLSGLLVFGLFEGWAWLRYRRRKTRAQLLIRTLTILSVSLLAGWLVWNLHLEASIFTADTFRTASFALRIMMFLLLLTCTLRIARFPAIQKTAAEMLKKSTLGSTGSAVIAAFRLYPFRDEVFALCNHARLIQILDRAQEKKMRREAAPSKPIRVVAPRIQPVWFEPEAEVQPKEVKKAKIQEDGMKELKALYTFKEKQRACLDDSAGSLMSTFVLRHKGRRILWSLIDHGEMPIVFVLNDEVDRNMLAEEVIASLALFNPPELIDQVINDPLHNGLYFAGYENTVSVMNDINQLWKMIHTSMANTAKRQLTPGQSADEINMSLYEQSEDSEGYVRWKIVHFMEPHMSVRMNDLLVSEDGQQYGFLPVFYFSESEWNEDSDITDYLKNCEGLAVYSVTETAITNLKEEDEE